MGMHLTPVTAICSSSDFHALADLTLAKAPQLRIWNRRFTPMDADVRRIHRRPSAVP